jgi:hypothetical protein
MKRVKCAELNKCIEILGRGKEATMTEGEGNLQGRSTLNHSDRMLD